MGKAMTAPLAVVKYKGTALLRIKNLRIRESINRGDIQGIGSLISKELPPLKITCNANFDFHTTTMRESTVPKVFERNFQTVKDFTNHLLLQDEVQIDVYKRVEDSVDPQTGHKSSKLVNFASIVDLSIEEDSTDLAEAQASNKSQSFRYRTPILFPV